MTDLRKTARKLRKKHVGYEEYEKEGKYCPQIVTRKFGTWNRALKKAGLNVTKINRISTDELLENLKKVWDSLGRQPSSTEMVKPLSRFNRTAYKRRFGTWFGALRALVKAIKTGRLKSPGEAGDKKLRNAVNISRKKSAKEQNVSKSMRFDIFKRDNFRCRVCGASPANDPKVTLHVDHIIPVSMGGNSVLSNLQTLCSKCNYGKGAKSMMPHPNPPQRGGNKKIPLWRGVDVRCEPDRRGV